MYSVYLALVCLAVVYAIIWSVRADELPFDKIGGPFAMRRADDHGNGGNKRVPRVR